jgi:hypothetical protein
MYANLVKRFRIRESWDFEMRIASMNVPNHPIWGNPNIDINSGDFGRGAKISGARSVDITGRLNF